MFNTGNCASVPLVANIDGNGNNNGWGRGRLMVMVHYRYLRYLWMGRIWQRIRRKRNEWWCRQRNSERI